MSNVISISVSEVTTPRLMAAAKEFNISKDTLVDFLVGKGFSKDDLKPTSKLSEDMYRSLQLEFQSDKVLKIKSDQIDLPRGGSVETKKKRDEQEIMFKQDPKRPTNKNTEHQIIPPRDFTYKFLSTESRDNELNSILIPIEPSSQTPPSKVVKDKKNFLSYSKKDVDLAAALVKDVEQMGYKIWIDTSHIRVGKGWDREIEEAINQCDNFMVLLTQSSVASDNVRNEIDLALEENKNIIPILGSPCKCPLSIRRFQYIDLTSSYQDALKQLEKILK